MKKPRVNDFDPKAVPELGSPMDNLPAIRKPSEEPKLSPTLPKEKPETKPKKIKTINNTAIPSYHDTTIPLSQNEIIEIIRKAVKHLGKEAATYRFTLEEKKALSDIVYSYKGSGIRTSENELTRIAINFLVEDYRNNGENSILAKVIERLND
jgi:hypothetical protein